MKVKETGNRSGVIVHADDFGLSEEINLGIIEAYDHGILTSASVAANGRAFDHAVDLARARPNLDLGVHICLAEESPVAPPSEVPTLITPRGTFHRSAAAFVARYFTGRISLDDVACEIEKQIEKVVSTGLPVSHIDSHQHLHVLPAVYRRVVQIAKRHGVDFVRIPKERTSTYMITNGDFLRLLELKVLQCFCWLLPTAKHPEFLGFYYGGRLNSERLAGLLKLSAAQDVTEIMCHPGYSCERYSHWGYDHQSEVNALTDPDTREIVEALGIDLVGYCDLDNS